MTPEVIRRASAAACVVLLSACSLLQPGPELRSSYRLTETAAVVSDACLLRRAGGDTALLRDASSTVGLALARNTTARLQERGFTVGTTRTPMACALPAEQLRGVKLLTQQDGEPLKNGVQDLVVYAKARNDYALATAYRHLLRGVKETAVTAVDWGQQAAPLIDQKEAGLLAADLGANHVWVVSSGGIEASVAEGEQAVDRLINRVTQGGGANGPYEPGTLNDMASLVDLENRQVRWRIALTGERGNPSDLGNYQAAWAERLLAEALPYGGRQPEPEPVRGNTIPVTTSGASLPAPLPPAPPKPGPYVPNDTPLLGRPQAGGPVMAVLPAGASIDILRQMRNATGDWLYVSSGGALGWLPAHLIAVR